MNEFIRLVGENRAIEFLGIKLVGFNAENGKKLLFTIVFIFLVILLARGLHALTHWLLRRSGNERIEFWMRQSTHLLAAVLLLLGILSIWFDDPIRLATAMGLVTAGLAFALQKVVTGWPVTSSYCAAGPSMSATGSPWAACAATSLR